MEARKQETEAQIVLVSYGLRFYGLALWGLLGISGVVIVTTPGSKAIGIPLILISPFLMYQASRLKIEVDHTAVRQHGWLRNRRILLDEITRFSSTRYVGAVTGTSPIPHLESLVAHTRSRDVELRAVLYRARSTRLGKLTDELNAMLATRGGGELGNHDRE